MKKLLIILLSIYNLHAFSTTNIQLLYGNFNDNSYVFDTQNGGKTTITLEHFRTFEYGDVFMFADYSIADDSYKYHDDKNNLYGEFSPRLSLSKLSSSDLSFLFVKDVFLAFQYNRSDDNYDAYLYGLGANLEVAYFNNFGLNVYKKNQNIGENNYQLSLNYTSEKFFNLVHLNGFTDWTEYDFLSQNQLLFDIAKPFKTHNLYFGVEWHFYRQKPLPTNFNTKVISNTLQAMIKYSW